MNFATNIFSHIYHLFIFTQFLIFTREYTEIIDVTFHVDM